MCESLHEFVRSFASSLGRDKGRRERGTGGARKKEEKREWIMYETIRGDEGYERSRVEDEISSVL